MENDPFFFFFKHGDPPKLVGSYGSIPNSPPVERDFRIYVDHLLAYLTGFWLERVRELLASLYADFFAFPHQKPRWSREYVGFGVDRFRGPCRF